jgi:hypothetical protein
VPLSRVLPPSPVLHRHRRRRVRLLLPLFSREADASPRPAADKRINGVASGTGEQEEQRAHQEEERELALPERVTSMSQKDNEDEVTSDEERCRPGDQPQNDEQPATELCESCQPREERGRGRDFAPPVRNRQRQAAPKTRTISRPMSVAFLFTAPPNNTSMIRISLPRL